MTNSRYRCTLAAVDALLLHLVALYGETTGRATLERLRAIVANYRPRLAASTPGSDGGALSQRDAILITYGDQVHAPGTAPLQTLATFGSHHLAGLVSGLHILPFYPYSSDDGFSVLDYRAVDPALGTWDDISRIGREFRLMFDAVVNHISAGSVWFQGFVRGDPRYHDYFIVVPPGADLSRVVRPRALPLVTTFDTPRGLQALWTTFSADQIDLNYHNPDVLLEIVDLFLFYVSHGATFIRLDAVAFLWKEFGTTCLSLPQTHHIVQLLRAVLDQVAPHVLLITETNVPHAENLTYLGDGTNEAQLVYNFALPPLVLHTFHMADASALSAWARTLALPSKRTTFFNFLASHDGIGLNPVRGILPDAAIDALVARALAHGGLVSYKNNADGTCAPYELNINYFDALSDPHSAEPTSTQVARFMSAQAIMLSLVGVPGIYFHSLCGSRGWVDGVRQTGQNRTINREKLDVSALEQELLDPHSRRAAVFQAYARFLRARTAHPAFHPHGTMRVLDAGASTFALARISPDEQARALCLHNVTDRVQPVSPVLLGDFSGSPALTDLVTGAPIDPANLLLAPYQTVWVA